MTQEAFKNAMSKSTSIEKLTLEEALKRNPKTLFEAREQLDVIRQSLPSAAAITRAGAPKAAEKSQTSTFRPFASIPTAELEAVTAQERAAGKKFLQHAKQVVAEIRGVGREADPGEQIFITNGKSVVIRNGEKIEVAALEETKKFRDLAGKLETEKNPRERFQIAADIGEWRRTYGGGRNKSEAFRQESKS